jgi:pimeloyl-ACP methyl ester carboxylesterase
VPQLSANGIKLEYVSQGDPAKETLLLIMGLGTQLTGWPEELCETLVGYGYHVLRFDNRDIGLSERINRGRAPNIPLLAGMRMLGLPVRAPYTLDDMARDALGLLDGLGIEKVHLVGASMGGMIAQLFAARFPGRTHSLTSIMSTTGHPSLPRAERSATRALMLKPDNPLDPNSVIERNVKVRKALQSRSLPKTDTEIRETAAAAVARGGYEPDGVARQLAAILAAKERRQLLGIIDVPALVLHGDEDPLVKVECGIDTAEHLPNGELHIVRGMGHDLPTPLLPEIAERIHATAQRASPAATRQAEVAAIQAQ